MRLHWVLAVAAVIGGSALPAQEPASGQSGLVVTGRREAERRAEASDYVRAVSSLPVDGQFARWHRPLCPAAIGLAPDMAAIVVERVRAVAFHAGAPLAPRKCRPNARIIFTSDARTLVAALERERPRLLATQSPQNAELLRKSDAAVRWWPETLTEGVDGDQMSATPPAAFGPIGSLGPSIPANERTKFGSTYRSSIISTAICVTLTDAIVLVDVPRTTGHRLQSVADYAAFVLLARVRLGTGKTSAATILSLFSAAPPAELVELTSSDRAYLTALYTGHADRPAKAQRQAIVGQVAHQGER